MRSARHVRVLMLGWEYPPRYAGGLGKACQGLSQALAKQGAQVFFVLPSFPQRVSEQHLEVVGAQECLIEAGWQPELFGKSPNGLSQPSLGEVAGKVSLAEAGVRLFPYGAHPKGEMSSELRRFIDQMSAGQMSTRQEFATGAPRGSGAKLSERPQAPVQESSSAGPISSSEIYGTNLWTEIERYCFTVQHILEAHEVDLVHAHDWMTFPAAFEVHRRTGAPVFLHVHATEYDRSGENLNHEVFRIEREGFRNAHHIFVVSRYTAGILERLYGISKKKITVVYNAPEEETKTEFAAAKTSRKLQVVFLGRMTFQKGPDHFLRAAALVKEANPRVQFVLCGTGDMLDRLQAQVKRLGLENQVQFAGFLDPVAVDKMLQTSRVLVMPSVSEPFGLVALEAISWGIPVIISKQSGVREVLHRALQVDFWDHEKLADQILAAIRLPVLSKQLVEEGVDQLRQLSWEKSAHIVLEAYRRHLGSIYAQLIGGAHGH